jgi:hypothetical protein
VAFVAEARLKQTKILYCLPCGGMSLLIYNNKPRMLSARQQAAIFIDIVLVLYVNNLLHAGSTSFFTQCIPRHSLMADDHFGIQTVLVLITVKCNFFS